MNADLICHFQALTYVELPYMEDVRDFEFAPVYNDSVKPNGDQLQAADDLISAMMLQGEGDE